MSGRLRRMLVPVDGSLGSRHAVVFANELAEATGASVTLLHVVQLEAAEAMGMRHRSIEAIRGMVRAKAEPALLDARRRFGKYVQLEEAVELGETVPEILGCAKQRDVDLIVIGSRGLGPIKELLVGSVSERVVHEARCPVTVVH